MDEAVRRSCRWITGKNSEIASQCGWETDCKIPRYGNVNRDRLKQWETLEEGVRLVHGDILPKRQRHKLLEPRDPEGTDERRSSFTNAAIAQA